jgi:type I restriction enzyme S subunit
LTSNGRGWREVKLKDVCREITVGYVGPMAKEYVDEGVPFLRSQNIQLFRLDLSSVKYVSPQFHSKLKKSALTPGDVAVVRTGYPGTACVIPETLPVANCADLVVIRPSEELDSRYLAGLFNSTWGRGKIAGSLVGVAQQHFNVGAAKEMVIHLPPLSTQRKVASVLSAYDDLIENHNRRIEIFEEMARRIYQEWFVHFRFPGHKKVRMVKSDLGLIPEGWEVKKSSDALLVNAKTKVPKEGEKPFVPMSSLSNNSMLIGGVELRSGNSGSKFRNGDTLFARITPSLENGKTGYVQFLPKNDVAFGSTEFIVLRSKTLCSEYVYLLARSNEFRDNAIKSMTGASGRQRVQEQCFDNFLLAHPDPETLGTFSKVVSPLFHIVYVLAKKNENLRHTRDLLLPKLISGEVGAEGVRVSDEPQTVHS